MKKLVFTLLTLCGIVLPVSASSATMAAADEDDSLIFWDIVDTEPLLIDGEQITVNAIQYNDGGGVEALIDEDYTTWFHSSYSETCNITDDDGNTQQVDNLYPSEKHWIQFDLVDAQTDLIFQFLARNSAYNDTPDDITILATNTPDDSRSWTEVAHLTDFLQGYASTSEMAGKEIKTPHIALGDSYRYVRMVINHTFSGRTNDLGIYYWNLAELQIYPAAIIQDPIQRLLLGTASLTQLAEQMYGIEDDYKGELPGFYGANEVDAYIAAYEDFLNAVEGDPTNAEVDVIIRQFRAAYEAMLASEVKVGTGYYRFINAYEEFFLQQDEEKAMVASDDGQWVRWRGYDPDDLSAIWILKQLPDGNFSIQNAMTQTYIDFIDATSQHVPMVEKQTTEQIIESVSRGIFMIYNTKLQVPYHTESHSSGAGKEGFIVSWGNSAQPHSTWYLHPVSDKEYERVRALGDQATIERDFTAARAAANKALMLAIDYLPFITEVSNDNDPSVSQLWSNAMEHREGSLVDLINGKTTDYFHSEYSTDDRNAITYENHSLFADLGVAADKFFWSFTPRNTADAYRDIPQDVIIYGSNDISDWEDPDTWTEIEHLTKGFPSDVLTTYVSPQIQPATPYRYLKFEVLDTYMHRTNTTTGMHFFTMSEFQVYSYNYDEVHSQYVNADGMKEAVDALTELLNELDRKERLTRPEVTALQEAVARVNELYVDHNELANQLAALLPDAELAYHNATDPVRKLIKDGSQFSVNSRIREGSFASILDGDWNTHFSTDWNDGAQNPDGTYGAKHHLQVDLIDAYDDVKLRMVGRYSWYFDMPQDIDIYITNDPDLGNDVLSSSDDWTLLTNISEGLPEEPWLEWTSDNLDIDGNRYLRMVVNDTWMNTSGTAERHDDTGMCFFTLAEFQVIQDADISETQYGYVPDVKKWADRLAELIAENQDKDKYDVWPRDVAALQEAMEELQKAFVHNDALLAIIDKAQKLADGAEVGDDFAYVPSQQVIDDLQAVCKAAVDVASGRTLQPQMDAEVEKVEAAMKTFYSKVRMPEVNHWYNIINVAEPRMQTTTDGDGNEVEVDIQAYCSGKAMATKNFAIGDSPSYGYYDPEDEEATYGDAAAAYWRFVPIEGTDCVAIQNMLCGLYIGAVTARGDYEGKPLLTDQPAPYKVEYFDAGELIFVSQDSLNLENNYGGLHAQERNGGPIVAWPVEHGNASCWNVREVDDKAQYLTMPVKTNTISIMTLPFAIQAGSGIGYINSGDAKTYALSAVLPNDDGTTSLNLVEQEAFAAGEPFFLVYGDFEDENSEQEDELIYINRPADVNPLAVADGNGLVGAIGGATIQEEGLGYFRGNKLLASGAGRITIPGLSGYIRAGLCQNRDDSPDLVLTCGQTLLNGIEVIKNEPFILNNVAGTVFDLTGRPVANGRLSHGLYIIGGHKVLVK